MVVVRFCEGSVRCLPEGRCYAVIVEPAAHAPLAQGLTGGPAWALGVDSKGR